MNVVGIFMLIIMVRVKAEYKITIVSYQSMICKLSLKLLSFNLSTIILCKFMKLGYSQHQLIHSSLANP
jgi:hypothetical protein